MKRQLQTCIDKLTDNSFTIGTILYTSFNLDLSSGWVNLRDNEAPIVWHEAILDHYWDQLENEIDRRKQLGLVTKIEGSVHVENVEMKKECLATLVTALSGQVSTIEYIDFHNANICAEGIISLSKSVDVSSNLQKLYLHHNRIDNIELARRLSMSLKSHARIRVLNLAHCDLGINPEILSVILQTDLSIINLEQNNIDSSGVVKIADFLRVIHPP